MLTEGLLGNPIARSPARPSVRPSARPPARPRVRPSARPPEIEKNEFQKLLKSEPPRSHGITKGLLGNLIARAWW